MGVLAWIAINLVVGFATLFSSGTGFENATFATAAVLLAAGALVGGGVVAWVGIRTGRPVLNGLGLGLMIGWALTSIVTAGWCTGLNPALYS